MRMWRSGLMERREALSWKLFYFKKINLDMRHIFHKRLPRQLKRNQLSSSYCRTKRRQRSFFPNLTLLWNQQELQQQKQRGWRETRGVDVEQYPDFPQWRSCARVNRGTGGLCAPDLSIAHSSLLARSEWSPLEPLSSDHIPILSELGLAVQSIAEVRPRLRWNWKQADWPAYSSALETFGTG